VSGVLEILRLPDDRARWVDLLDRVRDHDVYHRPEYLALFDGRSQHAASDAFFGRPCMFVLEDASGLALHPLLERPLDGVAGLGADSGFGDESVGLRDLVSPYGYAGPLFEAERTADREVLAARFSERFAERCRRDRVVAEFVRFHPVLGNAAQVGWPEVERRGDVVVVDLCQDDAGLLAAMSQTTRSMIRGAARRGIEFVEASVRADDEVAALERLYLETMRRRAAAPEYLFPSGFFARMVAQLGDSIALLVAREAGVVVAAALFLARGRHASYAFAGADAETARPAAGRAIIYGGMRWARDRGCATMILGGGVGAGDDGLHRFKRSFSSGSRPFHTAGRIHLPEAYVELASRRRRQLERSGQPTRRGPGYFPEYRR